MFIILIAVFIAAGVIISSVSPSVIQTIQENREYLYATVGIGTSMYPHIENGDIMLILEKDSPGFSVSVGDIVVYEMEEKIVAHRVVVITNSKYHVKGDNNDEIDRVLTMDEIIGKVVSVVDNGNFIGKTIVSSMV